MKLEVSEHDMTWASKTVLLNHPFLRKIVIFASSAGDINIPIISISAVGVENMLAYQTHLD